MKRRIFLCRCEDVTHAEIEHALSLGLSTIEELKRYTGLGTGPCQGKECQATLAAWLQARGHAPETLQSFTPRPPTEPVTFGALAALEREDETEAEANGDAGEPSP